MPQGTNFPVEGRYELSIKIKKKKFLHTVYVVHGLRTGAILGVDFLDKNRARIDLGKREIEFGDPGSSEVCMIKRMGPMEEMNEVGTGKSKEVDRIVERIVSPKDGPQEDQDIEIWARKDKVIDPYVEAIINVKFDSREKRGLYVIAGPGVPEGLVRNNIGSGVYIPMRNESPGQIKICKGDVVAVARKIPIEEIKNLATLEDGLEEFLRRRRSEEVATITKTESLKSKGKEEYLRKNFKCDLEDGQKERLFQVIWENQDVFSQGQEGGGPRHGGATQDKAETKQPCTREAVSYTMGTFGVCARIC